MMKRLSLLLICLLQVFFIVAQDEQKNVEISVNSSQPVELEFSSCKLSLSAFQYANSQFTLYVDVQNTTQDHIFLFGRSYSQKELKKRNIRFYKKSYGSTSKTLLLCEGLNEDEILHIEPSGNRVLTIEGISDINKKCELPLYIAKTKMKKYYIKNRVKILSNIKFSGEKVADNEFESISKKCQKLIDEIGHLTICPRTTHSISKEKQKEPYTNRILDLKDEISDVKTSHQWRERDEDYQKYKELLIQLDNIKFKEQYCGKCGQSSVHQCRYCKMTSKDALSTLQRIYQMLDIGRTNKTSAISSVEPLHKAWVGGCPKLKQKVDNDASTRAKMERYYDSIIHY